MGELPDLTRLATHIAHDAGVGLAGAHADDEVVTVPDAVDVSFLAIEPMQHGERHDGHLSPCSELPHLQARRVMMLQEHDDIGDVVAGHDVDGVLKIHKEYARELGEHAARRVIGLHSARVLRK